MSQRASRPATRRVIAQRLMSVLLTLLTLWSTASCKKNAPRRESAASPQEQLLVVAQEQTASWVRNFNPLLAPGSVRWPTPAGIYEPLMIYNAIEGKYVPWLATKYEFGSDNAQLSFETRAQVRWSDGKPFTAKDVAFTFELLKEHPALDLHGVWKYLDRVEAPSEQSVVFHFAKVFTPGLFRIAQQPIVPEHVWKKVANPVTFTNPDPVATGPFTVVKTFQNQVYELGKNPDYWQPGKPYIAGLRFPAYPGNEPATLAIASGEIDWAGKFIPDVDKVFVAKDPEHHKYWYPNLGTVHSVFANTTRPPLNDVRVRKALSMAINRERIAKIAVYGYTKPVPANGLSRAYDKWSNLDVLEDKGWVTHNPQRAAALLDQAGLKKGSDGMRSAPDGQPLSLEINVVTGWSDWITAVQLMIEDFKQVGIAARMRTIGYGPWYDALQRGQFDLSMGFVEEGPTPYSYYRYAMGAAEKKPIGQPALMNWQRFEDPEVDEALRAFEKTADPAEQHKLANVLQSLYSKHAPLIPLHPSPSWGQCNTKRFVGFPSQENPYARLSPFSPPEYLLVLTSVKPR